MKFVYEFRTSDNARHDGVVSAPDRDAAYQSLREKGIRPSRLVEAPGILNKLFGKGKRWMAIAVLTLLVVAAAAVLRSANRTIRTVEAQLAAAMPRHQIAALPDGWENAIDGLFPDPLDRLLARHAQPGVVVAPRPGAAAPVAADGVAVDELRRIVAGMRQEANGFLSLGKSLEDLERYLEERQRMEADYRERTVRQARAGEIGVDEANRILSAMELKPIEIADSDKEKKVKIRP